MKWTREESWGALASGAQPPHKLPNEPNTDNFFTLATMLLKSCDAAQVRKDPVRFARVCAELRDVVRSSRVHHVSRRHVLREESIMSTLCLHSVYTVEV